MSFIPSSGSPLSKISSASAIELCESFAGFTKLMSIVSPALWKGKAPVEVSTPPPGRLRRCTACRLDGLPLLAGLLALAELALVWFRPHGLRRDAEGLCDAGVGLGA